MLVKKKTFQHDDEIKGTKNEGKLMGSSENNATKPLR
jgi:hypothetical protein